jgi:hypothetical protein
MSGGHFNYNQYHITEIADSIEKALNKQGKEIPMDKRIPDDVVNAFRRLFFSVGSNKWKDS